MKKNCLNSSRTLRPLTDCGIVVERFARESGFRPAEYRRPFCMLDIENAQASVSLQTLLEALEANDEGENFWRDKG